MTNTITWRDDRVKLSEIEPREDNPRFIEEQQAQRLIDSYFEFGQPLPLLLNPDGTLNDGHQRLKTWIAEFGPNFEVDVRIPSRALTRKEWQKLTVYLHKGTTGEWDFSRLEGWGINHDLVGWGFDKNDLEGLGFDFGDNKSIYAEDVEFEEYDESIADDVEMIECPSCGHHFPK